MRRDHVTVAGRDEIHPEGSYYLEWWHAGDRHREAAGPDAFIAAEKARQKQAEMSAAHSGIIPQPTPEPSTVERVTLKAALGAYLDYIQYHRTLRTFRTYRPVLAHFGTFCTRTYVDDVSRDDLLAFATACLKKGQKGKSVYNKLVVLAQLLKQNGRAKVLHATDWPSFVETVRPIYEDAELKALFGQCTADEKMRFKFYLMTGLRDAEGRHVTWRDVDMRYTAIRVTAKPHWGFSPKNWEEREVPVPKVLIDMLRAFKPSGAGPDDPIFPSSTGKPDGAMLEKLKAAAWHGGLNCGHCATVHRLEDGTRRINRCAEGPFCKRWFLHKFRHTYATRTLQDGIDIRTLQSWMGHRDIASTMVYLKGLRNSDVQTKLNQGSMAAFA